MNIPVANACVGEDEARAAYDTVMNGRLSSGKKVKEFENKFCEYAGAKNAIAVNNGTAALHVSLAAVGIENGDEVIIPSLSFISTANAVLYQGAIPVMCESDELTYNISVNDIENKISKKTKAVIAVDMNGLPFDYDEIMELCKRRNVYLIADSAEALGSEYKGNKVGSIAPIHCFSFFPNKIITTAEGGMITTIDNEIARRMRIILNQGQEGRYNHTHLGFNYRMTEISAAIGLEQLKKIPYLLEEKERLVSRYNNAFGKTRNIRPPYVPKYATKSSWYMYAISVENIDRDEVVSKLGERGIETRMSFPPIHTQPYYRERFGYSSHDLPRTMAAWSKLIDIPIWPGMPSNTQDYVIDTLISICETC